MVHQDSSVRSTYWVELKIASHPANVAAARYAAEAFAGICGFGEMNRGEIGLCVNEALANVHRHAHGGATDRPVTMRLERTEDGMRIVIRDWGCGMDPQASMSRARDVRRPGGLGLICMRELMDEVVFEPQGDGMLLTMERRKPRGVSETRRVG